VKGKDPTTQPKVCAKRFNFEVSTLMGIIMDLDKFTLRQVEEAKACKSPFRKNN
jgi:hypothetical protein